ncbi:unnamed protein product [Adineta ricciae]|uniref:Uncharacterized protein n=1 Tax=Adineta ricciae TaxID=249248 RepID=A0A815G278_ADIRI|nr:unnamed protein product [Adineta ricciae]
MAPTKRKRSPSPVKTEQKPRTQAFLDHLSMDEAKAWRNEIIKCGRYKKLVNHRHISSNLSIDELESATSAGSFNGTNFFVRGKILYVCLLGAYFMKWMECEIEENLLCDPPDGHPRIMICKNTSSWPSIVEKLSTFCWQNSSRMAIYCHHITLRSMNEKPLRLLCSSTDGEQGVIPFFLC